MQQQDGRYKTWKMKIWLEVFFILLLVGVCLALITENRHPVKTLAWILLLVFVPGVGLVLYYLVGMNKRQRRLISSDKLAAWISTTLPA